MRHYAESITTRRISRAERERVWGATMIVHMLTDQMRHAGLSDHFQSPEAPVEAQAITLVNDRTAGWDSEGRYHALHEAYFAKPLDL